MHGELEWAQTPSPWNLVAYTLKEFAKGMHNCEAPQTWRRINPYIRLRSGVLVEGPGTKASLSAVSKECGEGVTEVTHGERGGPGPVESHRPLPSRGRSWAYPGDGILSAPRLPARDP